MLFLRIVVFVGALFIAALAWFGGAEIARRSPSASGLLLLCVVMAWGLPRIADLLDKAEELVEAHKTKPQ